MSATGSSLVRFLAAGSGIGIAVEGPRGAESLVITAVKVRPSGAKTLNSLTIPDFLSTPCVEWGAAYSAFASKLGLAHTSAVVVLPRTDVILRQLEMPGVDAKDLENAVQFQLDGLHPWEDGDVYATWSRMTKWGGNEDASTVLVGIARREAVDRYVTLFAEADIPVAGFTCSAAAIYSALRLRGAGPSEPLLAFVSPAGSAGATSCEASSPESDEGLAEQTHGEPAGQQGSAKVEVSASAIAVSAAPANIEVYGESPARILLSAAFQVEPERAAALAASELRLESPEVRSLGEVFGSEHPVAFAAAMASACPWRSLPFNLLPEGARQGGSRLQWVLTGVMVAAVVLAAVGYAMLPGWQNRQYYETLQAEIERVQPQASEAGAIDEKVQTMREQMVMLRDLRRRTSRDMDVLAELTGRLAPPAWLQQLDINEKEVIASGIAPQASSLVGDLDGSALFEASQFTTPPRRAQEGESFRIRMTRSALPDGPMNGNGAAPVAVQPQTAEPSANAVPENTAVVASPEGEAAP